jgi:murein L,D-transpeptidase YcbB/YkuD
LRIRQQYLKEAVPLSPEQSKGSSSNNAVFVTAIKDMLNSVYYYESEPVGGYSDFSPKVWNPDLGGSTYDSETSAAVEDYQAFIGIQEDGIVGPQTWTQLYMCS